jgi:hypothetical protein
MSNEQKSNGMGNHAQDILQPKSFNRKTKIFIYLFITSVDTDMCCPKGKCGCQYFKLLTLRKEKKIRGHRGPGFF